MTMHTSTSLITLTATEAAQIEGGHPNIYYTDGCYWVPPSEEVPYGTFYWIITSSY